MFLRSLVARHQVHLHRSFRSNLQGHRLCSHRYCYLSCLYSRNSQSGYSSKTNRQIRRTCLNQTVTMRTQSPMLLRLRMPIKEIYMLVFCASILYIMLSLSLARSFIHFTSFTQKQHTHTHTVEKNIFEISKLAAAARNRCRSYICEIQNRIRTRFSREK